MAQETKYQLKASKFLEWYISDAEDLQTLGERTAERMKETGYGDIGVHELFNDCGFIPARILEDLVDLSEEDEIEDLSEIEFINDLKHKSIDNRDKFEIEADEIERIENELKNK